MIDLLPKLSTSSLPSKCPYCGSLSVSQIRRGKNYCGTCRKEWSWRKGTVFEGTKIPKEKAEPLLKMIREGLSPAAIARSLGMNYYATIGFYNKSNQDNPMVSKTFLRRQRAEARVCLKEISRTTGITLPVIEKAFSKKSARKIRQVNFTRISECLIAKKENEKAGHKIRHTSSVMDFGRIFKEKNKKKLVTDIICILSLAHETSVEAMKVPVPIDFFNSTIYKTIPPKSMVQVSINKLIERKIIGRDGKDLTLYKEIKITDFSVKQKTHLRNKLRTYLEKKGLFIGAYRLVDKKTQVAERNRLFRLAVVELEEAGRSADREKVVEEFAHRAKIGSGALSIIWNYHYTDILNFSKGAAFKAFIVSLEVLGRTGFFRERFSLKGIDKTVTPELESELEYDIHGMVYIVLEKLKQFDLPMLGRHVASFILGNRVSPGHVYYPYYIFSIILGLIKGNDLTAAKRYLEMVRSLPDIGKNARLTATMSYYECLFSLAENEIDRLELSLERMSQLITDIRQVNATTIFNLHEITIQWFFAKGKVLAAFFFGCCWLKTVGDNRQRLFNVLFYIRLALEGIPGTTALSAELFGDVLSEKRYIPLDCPDATNFGDLIRLLLDHIGISAVPPEKATADYFARAIDRYFSVFRDRVLDKDIRDSKDYAVFRRLSYLEKKAVMKPETVLNTLLAYKSSRKHTFHRNSYDATLLLSYYFRKYEQTFLETKVVCKRFPVQIPRYVKRLVNSTFDGGKCF